MEEEDDLLPPCVIPFGPKVLCGTPSVPDAPFPICVRHTLELYEYVNETARSSRLPGVSDQDYVRLDLPRPVYKRDQSVVYYIQEHDGYIKIGFSADLRQRLANLRLSHKEVLATEPGGRELEKMRHEEFAHLRIGRWEKFAAADELRSHIAMIRSHFGEPVFPTAHDRLKAVSLLSGS